MVVIWTKYGPNLGQGGRKGFFQVKNMRDFATKKNVGFTRCYSSKLA
jgi:hypothetical protein